MKDGMESTAARRAPEPATPEAQPAPAESRADELDGFINRKLIRPSLNRAHLPSSTSSERENGAERRERNGGERSGERTVLNRKATPVEQTHAESFYYQKQMQSRTPMVLVMKDGEEIHGWIEWYDRNCIKVNRSGQPNILIYKCNIRYMYKAGENSRR